MGCPTGIDPVLPVSQTSVQATTLRTPLAGILGFEPRLTESKSAVLPLHYIPTNHIEIHLQIYFYMVGARRIELRTHGLKVRCSAS